MKTLPLYCTAIVLVATLFASCKKDKETEKDDIRTKDPITRTILVNGTGTFVEPVMRYYNLETGLEISASEAFKSDKWDIAFERVNIFVNSFYGDADGQVLNEKMVWVDEAPETGYKKDGEFEELDIVFADMNYCLFANWYDRIDGKTYPKSPRTYIIRTQSGKYVKLQLNSWYNPDNPAQDGWFSFTYTIQPGGSRKFVK